MSDLPPLRPPGPWDQVAPAIAAAPDAAAYRQPPRQSLAVAILSTLLLAGTIAWFGGWQMAVAGVIGVFVHEYGHVLAMNALGCGPARIHIVPFLGGAASPARPPTSEFRDVIIALAGPVFGLLAALPFLVAARYFGPDPWAKGALFIVAINLVNLFPAPPLDGSRALGPALARIHPVVERVVLVLIGVAALGWAVNDGRYLLAIPIAFGTFWVVHSGPQRHSARPLSGVQAGLSLLLYGLAIAACAAVLFAAIGGASLTDGSLGRFLHHQPTPKAGGYQI